MAAYKAINKGIGLATKIIMYIGGFCLMFMMVATMVDVVVRTLGGSIIGVYEISEILMVPIVFFTLPYVELFGGHAEVDLFYNLLPKVLRTISSLITNIAASAYLYLMVKYSFERYAKLTATGEMSALLHIPYSLLYIFIVIGAIASIIAILLRTVQLFIPAETEEGKEDTQT